MTVTDAPLLAVVEDDSSVPGPGMSGVALQTQTGLVYPGLPVVLITGRNDYGAGADTTSNSHGLFRKPFDAGELPAAVRIAIQGGR